MLHLLRRLRIITVGDVGWWHGHRRNYPQQAHGISMPLHAQPPAATAPVADAANAAPVDSNVTPLRPAGDSNHG